MDTVSDNKAMQVKQCLPYFTEGVVVNGFGRGAKQLGFPTANFADDVVASVPPDIDCGVYYGWAQLAGSSVHGMVMSIGYNMTFNNQQRTMEIHIFHKFTEDFYGQHLKVVVAGYLRPMRRFSGADELIEAIKQDIKDAEIKLASPDSLSLKQHPFFS